jgi:multidrug efflux pump subunit AcrA (membrane-fusion protein)
MPAASQQLWTCGMHPQIIKTEPGNCPICGMKLTPIRSTAAVQTPTDSNAIHIDSATVQRMNLKTALVTRGPVRREIRTVGSVAYNEEGLRDITTKYEGWIEKLLVNATYTRVKTGEPLFEIYSPDLYNAELNFVVAHGSEGETNGPLTRAALGRLQLLDVPPELISDLAKTGKAQRTFVYRAPADGVVIEKSAVVGEMMKPGERIYRLADLSTVWVLAQVYEQDLPFVRQGQTASVSVTYGPDRSYTGSVQLVVPQVEEQTRAATARIVLPNPDGALRPGMYADVRFEAQIADSAVLVPEPAILRSGDRNTVFVARDGGTFEARTVKLGARSSSGDYEVLAGLEAGERVVTSGQFMLDSESQLREAIEKMQSGSSAAAAGGAVLQTVHGSTEDATSTNVAAASQLRDLAVAAADAAAALAKDDLAAYEAQRTKVNDALSAWLAAAGGGEGGPGSTTPATHRTLLRTLPTAADLKSARDSFEPFSTAVTDMARSAHLEQSAGLHAFECPMPPSGGGKARWLQRTAGTKNPFYGAAMPTCGEELK